MKKQVIEAYIGIFFIFTFICTNIILLDILKHFDIYNSITEFIILLFTMLSYGLIGYYYTSTENQKKKDIVAKANQINKLDFSRLKIIKGIGLQEDGKHFFTFKTKILVSPLNWEKIPETQDKLVELDEYCNRYNEHNIEQMKMIEKRSNK